MPTLRELLEKGESWKYGIDYRTVEAEKQSLSDFEDNGLRVNFGQRFGDLPNFGNLTERLYGTETLRITRQSTSLVDDMKANTNADQGLIGGFIGNVGKEVNKFASKLGIPVLQIPTRVSGADELKKAINGGAATGTGENSKSITSIPEALAKIRKSGEGNILGKFLKQTAEGTPNELGRRALGNAKNIAKNAAKNLLLGNGSGGINQASRIEQTLSLRPEKFTYGLDLNNQYSKVTKKSGDGELGLLKLLNDIQNSDVAYSDFITKIKQNEGIDYSNAGTPTKPNEIFPKFPEFTISSLTQNIPGKRDKTYLKDSQASSFRIDKSEIGKFNTTSDKVNLYGVWEGDAEGNPTEQIVDNTTIDDLDFIPLRFYSVGKKKGVSFKATVSGITETFSPSWESSNFIGNPYSFYTYQTINRKIDFSFSIYSLSGEEHKKNWEKLDFFSSLVYPQNTRNDVYVTPPLLKLTLGNMYKNKLGFFESLSYTIDDNTPWEIGYQFNDRGRLVDNGDLKNYKLPTIINVTVSYQIIETSNDVAGKNLYAYIPSFATPEQQQQNFERFNGNPGFGLLGSGDF